MNFEDIKELGRKTNRIIEIEGELKSVEKLAGHLLDGNASLAISLDVSDHKKKSANNFMEDFIKNVIEPSLPPNAFISRSVRSLSPLSMLVNLPDKYQWIIFNAMKEALTAEQSDLKEAIQKHTAPVR